MSGGAGEERGGGGDMLKCSSVAFLRPFHHLVGHKTTPNSAFHHMTQTSFGVP